MNCSGLGERQLSNQPIIGQQSVAIVDLTATAIIMELIVNHNFNYFSVLTFWFRWYTIFSGDV